MEIFALEEVVVRPLDEKYISDVVRIHQKELSYTFNSRMGFEHLSFIYQIMTQHHESYVGVALFQNKPVGVISGTFNTNKIMTLLLRSLTLRQAVNTFYTIMKQPVLIQEWRKGSEIGRQVFFEGALVQPALTAIAVDSSFHGQGIGKRLVGQLEYFFKQKGVLSYRLDTLKANLNAQKFYTSLGSQEVEYRADSIIYFKEITYE